MNSRPTSVRLRALVALGRNLVGIWNRGGGWIRGQFTKTGIGPLTHLMAIETVVGSGATECCFREMGCVDRSCRDTFETRLSSRGSLMVRRAAPRLVHLSAETGTQRMGSSVQAARLGHICTRITSSNSLYHDHHANISPPLLHVVDRGRTTAWPGRGQVPRRKASGLTHGLVH